MITGKDGRTGERAGNKGVISTEHDSCPHGVRQSEQLGALIERLAAIDDIDVAANVLQIAVMM